MEPKFQTSFIPKKPLSVSSGIGQGPARRSVSLFMTLALVIFILSLVAAGGAYVLQGVLNSQLNEYKSDLAKDQDQFNTDLITTLETANTKISIANSLLANHLDVAQIFNIISQLTIDSVQWTSFQFSAPDNSASPGTAASGDITISMQGEADSFYSIAYQSDVFGQSAEFGTNKVLKDPVLSNLSVAPDGHVSFSFTASIDPSELSYAAALDGTSATSSPSPAASSTSQ